MLDINVTAVITQALAFVLLAWLLAKVGFGPLGAQIEARQSEIQSTLDQIAADRRAMEETRADYERRLANIEAEAREHIAGAVKLAQEEAVGIVEKARADAAVQRDRAVAEIDQERKKAVAEIRAEMSELAVIAASKILEREINPAVHRELIGDFINQVNARA